MKAVCGAAEKSSAGYEGGVYPGPLGWVFYGAYHGVKWLFVWD